VDDISSNLLNIGYSGIIVNGWNFLVDIGETVNYNVSYLYNKGPSEYINEVGEYWSNSGEQFVADLDAAKKYVSTTPLSEIGDDIVDVATSWESYEFVVGVIIAKKANIKLNLSQKRITSLNKGKKQGVPDFDVDDLESFKGASSKTIENFLKDSGWEIKPLKKGKPGFRAVNPQNPSDVITVIKVDPKKIKAGSKIPEVKQNNYIKRKSVDPNKRAPLE